MLLENSNRGIHKNEFRPLGVTLKGTLVAGFWQEISVDKGCFSPEDDDDKYRTEMSSPQEFEMELLLAASRLEAFLEDRAVSVSVIERIKNEPFALRVFLFWVINIKNRTYYDSVFRKILHNPDHVVYYSPEVVLLAGQDEMLAITLRAFVKSEVTGLVISDEDEEALFVSVEEKDDVLQQLGLVECLKQGGSGVEFFQTLQRLLNGELRFNPDTEEVTYPAQVARELATKIEEEFEDIRWICKTRVDRVKRLCAGIVPVSSERIQECVMVLDVFLTIYRNFYELREKLNNVNINVHVDEEELLAWEHALYVAQQKLDDLDSNR